MFFCPTLEVHRRSAFLSINLIAYTITFIISFHTILSNDNFFLCVPSMHIIQSPLNFFLKLTCIDKCNTNWNKQTSKHLWHLGNLDTSFPLVCTEMSPWVNERSEHKIYSILLGLRTPKDNEVDWKEQIEVSSFSCWSNVQCIAGVLWYDTIETHFPFVRVIDTISYITISHLLFVPIISTMQLYP